MKSLPELMAQLDCYVGHVDGYAYRSYDRLMRMRKKGVFKPKGPLDIYQYPGTDAMKTGWFLNDERLKRTNWHRTVTEFRKIPTDVTRFRRTNQFYTINIRKLYLNLFHRFYKEALLIDRCFKI